MQKKLFGLIFSFIVICLLTSVFSCHINNIRKTPAANMESLENRFFTLDMENNSYQMSAIQTHFFTTFPHDDPTQGNVVYDRREWVNEKMIELKKSDGLYLYIKDRNDNTSYDSFRLTSKAYFNLNEHTQRILFVYKGKLPSAKGIWPAWWLYGGMQDTWIYNNLGYVESDAGLDKYSGKGHFYDTPSAVNSTDWPGAGEIDIIETINGENIIHNTLHTCPQMCDAEWNDDGHIVNCANAKLGDPNPGCSGKSYKTISPEGTFACLWARNTIKFFYWAADKDVRGNGGPLSKNPDLDRWRIENLMNEVRLQETEWDCDDELHGAWQCNNCESSTACLFKNMKMIFNITLCGTWAGNKFDDTENALTNCQRYIFGAGRDLINNQYLKIEYVSVRKI